MLKIIHKLQSHEIINGRLFFATRLSLQANIYGILQLQSKEQTEYLKNLIELIWNSQCHIYDFQICIQNMVYGEIFDTQIPHRIPIDKRLWVITNDPKELDEIIDYISTETIWGKNNKKYIEEAKRQFS